MCPGVWDVISLVKHLLVPFFTRIPFKFYSENRTCHRPLHLPLLIPSRLWSLSLEISIPGAMKLINMHHTHLSISSSVIIIWNVTLDQNYMNVHILICTPTLKYRHMHAHAYIFKPTTVFFPSELRLLSSTISRMSLFLDIHRTTYRYCSQTSYLYI